MSAAPAGRSGPVDPESLAGAMRGLRALDALAQLTAEDLRRLTVWWTATVAQLRGATFVDALADAAAEHGMTPPPLGSDPLAWCDQELAAIARALQLILKARGELGYGDHQH